MSLTRPFPDPSVDGNWRCGRNTKEIRVCIECGKEFTTYKYLRTRRCESCLKGSNADVKCQNIQEGYLTKPYLT